MTQVIAHLPIGENGVQTMIEVLQEGHFSCYLLAAMANDKMSIRELARSVEYTYEHIRKLVRGLANPFPELQSEISKVLRGFNQKEAQELVDLDRLQKIQRG